MLRRDFLKSALLVPLAGVVPIAAASVQPNPETDAETMVKLWLKSVEHRQGVSPVTKEWYEYQECLWTSYGNHLYVCPAGTCPGGSDEVPVYYPTPEMAWSQWKLAFEAYLKDNHGRIHWLTRPELSGPRSADPEAVQGYAVYAAAFVEEHA